MEEKDMVLTENKQVLQFVEEAAALTNPDRVIWIDGSEEQLEELYDTFSKSGRSIINRNF